MKYNFWLNGELMSCGAFVLGGFLSTGGFCARGAFVHRGLLCSGSFCPLWAFVLGELLSTVGFCPVTVKDSTEIQLYESAFTITMQSAEHFDFHKLPREEHQHNNNVSYTITAEMGTIY